MKTYQAEIWIRRGADKIMLMHSTLPIENKGIHVAPVNDMTYSQARGRAYEICQKLSRPETDEYKLQMIRDDGHKWSETPWFRYNGRGWSKIRDENAQRRQQSPGFQTA